jgi:hypothetical protein
MNMQLWLIFQYTNIVPIAIENHQFGGILTKMEAEWAE